MCPTTTTVYTVTVSDNGVSLPTSDTITINVVAPPQTQANISICQNENPILYVKTINYGVINRNVFLFLFKFK